jgi:PAS domain S-box-containing protein
MKNMKPSATEEQQIKHTVDRLRALSDGINEVIYVSDPKTYEILFANRKTKEQFGDNILGQKCHKVFRDLNKPCPSCTNRKIFGKSIGKTYIWDHQNVWNKRWYRGISKAIKWPGGRYVRYCMAIDITGQKATEKALKESEERFRLFAESAMDLIYRYSLEKGFEYVNPASVRITGYTPEEHYNNPNLGLAIVHPEDRWKVKRMMNDLRKHHQPEKPVEIRWFHKTGNIVVTEQVNVPIYDDDGKLVAIEGIARDVTERIQMNEALKESEDRYRTLFEESPISLWEFDLSEAKKYIDKLRKSRIKNLREYLKNNIEAVVHMANLVRIVAANNTTLKLYKAENKHELGSSLIEVFGSEEYESFIELLAAIAEGRNTFETETTIRTLAGERIDVAVKVSVASGYEKTLSKVFASMIDVTEKKKMEEAMKDRERFFRSVVENSHNGTAIIDDNFTVVYANNELGRILGYTKEEMVGHDFRGFLDESSKDLVQDRYVRGMKGERVPSHFRFTAQKKNGVKREVEIKSARILDRNGKGLLIAQILDITERQNMERERKRFEDSLSALNTYGQSLNLAKSLDEIHGVTLEAMEKTLGFEYASILKVDGRTLRLMRNRGYSKNLSLRLSLDGSKGVTVRAAKTGKSVCVQDLRKERSYVLGKPGMLSEFAVPIKEEKKVIGVLNVESRRIAAFAEEDKKLLEILASHTATAITNLNRRERLSALNEYGKKLNMAQNPSEIYALTLNAMEKTLGFEFATFFIVEERELRLAAHRGYPKKLNVTLPLDGERGVSLKVAKTGRSVIIPDIRKEKAYVPGRPGMLSELAVPIKISDTVLGVLNVESERFRAFGESDRELLEILASHAATAMGNLRRQDQLRTLSNRLENLMKSTTETIHVKEMRQRLEVITNAIRGFGWEKVTISLCDENRNGIETVTTGFSKAEIRSLSKKRPNEVFWQERLGNNMEKFRLGEFYYLPRNDPWVRENMHETRHEDSNGEVATPASIPRDLASDTRTDWNHQDMLYAPLRTPEGRIVGILSMDDPIDGRKPTRESLAHLGIFLHQAAMIIENAQLIESLREAREMLEQKVEERTRELKISQEQLLKAERLAVIGELAGMVGHDLRNPLTSIAGATYYVKKRLDSQTDRKIFEMLELVEKNIAYSNKIIADLLDYSREIKLDLMETTPKTVITETLRLIDFPESIRLVDLTKNKPRIRIDVEKIKRCFVNVIRNAIDAMPNGGKLTIRCEKSDDSLRFALSDTGTGMSEETIAKVWTPLFTTKAKGMGFGLPICKRVVEAHGGSITATSIIGKGTTFIVTLPIEAKTKDGGEEIWVKTPESSLLMTTKT